MLGRETAWRVFSAEYNDATLEVSDEGERAPTYLVTPLGAKVNRLFFVGVLTANERIGESGDMWRAQVTDPTGVFHLYAGQYQPEAASVLADLTPPAIVAVSGKSRIYKPDAGLLYTSVRPETIRELDRAERDAWVLEAASATIQRIEAVEAAQKLSNPTLEAVGALGVPRTLADGIVRALQHYETIDTGRYREVVQDALEYLLPNAPKRERAPRPPPAPALPRTVDAVATARAGGAASAAPTPARPASAPTAPTPAATAPAPGESSEEKVFAFVAELDDGKGAPWEGVVSRAGKAGIDEEQVEEALNGLMDKGLIYEPVLGRLKKA